MGNFALNGSVPWLTNNDGELCLLSKESVEDVSHCLLDCRNFKDNRQNQLSIFLHLLPPISSHVKFNWEATFLHISCACSLIE